MPTVRKLCGWGGVRDGYFVMAEPSPKARTLPGKPLGEPEWVTQQTPRYEVPDSSAGVTFVRCVLSRLSESPCPIRITLDSASDGSNRY